MVVVYGEPLYVEQTAGDAEIERVTEEMGRRMMAAEERGFRHLGVAPDW